MIQKNSMMMLHSHSIFFVYRHMHHSALNFYLYYYSSILFRQQTVLLFRRLFCIQTKSDEIELPTRIYINGNARPESDDYDQQISKPSLTGGSFISDFYRE